MMLVAHSGQAARPSNRGRRVGHQAEGAPIACLIDTISAGERKSDLFKLPLAVPQSVPPA